MREGHQLRRSNDPSSSASAARAHVESGANKSQTERVYEFLLLAERECGRAATASEVEVQAIRAATSPTSPRYATYLILKRLNDLRAEGRVDNGPTIQCPVTKRQKTTWRAVRQTKLALITSISGEKGRPARADLLDALDRAQQILAGLPSRDDAVALTRDIRVLLRRAGR